MIINKNMRRIVIFTNVVFEEFGNQSIRNFVEGFLGQGYAVTFLTVHPERSDYMTRYISKNPAFELKYILPGQSAEKGSKGGISRKDTIFVRFLRKTLRYQNYVSNSLSSQWAGIPSTVKILSMIARHLISNPLLLLDTKCFVFIDVFGGLVAKYLKLCQPNIWVQMRGHTVGYYLGTVLKQFNGSNVRALAIMPLTFFGSYRVPHDRLIITDDGTDGERIFRTTMRYKKDILFIRNGVDDRLMQLTPQCRARSDGHIRFVSCSRLTTWKRVDRIIQFIYQIKTISLVSIELTIIGDGEERPQLEQLVSRLEMNKTVTFAGGLHYQEALSAISSHDYYIIMNDLSNLGNQVYESIVLGVVPLTIDDGSTDSLLVDGENAMKFPLSQNFEINAAKFFLSRHSADNLKKLRKGLLRTRYKLFSWKERSVLQQKFIFNPNSN